MTNENEDQNEQIEEIEEEEENEEPDSRLVKSVKRLIKLTKIDEEKLKGLSIEEQYDRLEFLADNMPKLPKSKKKKNKPIVPNPIDVDAPKFGKINKNSPPGVLSMSFNPIEVFKRSTKTDK